MCNVRVACKRNDPPKPLVWKATADLILEKSAVVRRIKRGGTPGTRLWGVCPPFLSLKPKEHTEIVDSLGAAFAFVDGTYRVARIGWPDGGFDWDYRLTKESKKLWRQDLIDGSNFHFRLGLDVAGLRMTAS